LKSRQKGLSEPIYGAFHSPRLGGDHAFHTLMHWRGMHEESRGCREKIENSPGPRVFVEKAYKPGIQKRPGSRFFLTTKRN